LKKFRVPSNTLGGQNNGYGAHGKARGHRGGLEHLFDLRFLISFSVYSGTGMLTRIFMSSSFSASSGAL
jgi:hypothetical protein